MKKFLLIFILLLIPIVYSSEFNISAVRHLYTFNESVGNYLDLGNNQVNSTFLGSFSRVDGLSGKAVNFTNTDVEGSYENSYSGSQYFSFWLKIEDLTGTGNGELFNDGDGSNAGKRITYNKDNQELRFNAYDASANKKCGGQNNLKSTIDDTDWHYYVIGINSTHCVYYIDSVLNMSVADGSTTRSSGNTGGFGEIADSLSWNSFDSGVLDLWIEYREFPGQEVINEIYNSSGTYPTALYPSFLSPTPEDGIHTNEQETINVLCGSGTVSLWFDQNAIPSAKVIDGALSPANYTTSMSTEGTYYYTASCDGGATNSSTRTLVYDTTEPSITINPSNSITTNNESVLTRVEQILMNMTIEDNVELFGLEVLIYKNGYGTDVLYNYTNLSLSGTTFNFIDYINFEGFDLGKYSMNITSSDSHTAEKISQYIVKEKLRELEFDTAEGNNIKIRSEGLSTTKATKFFDRYNFQFNFTSNYHGRKTFHIYSDNKIIYKKDSFYKGHFVVWNPKTKNGNWIDFEGLEETPTIRKINDYHYIVQYNNAPNKIVFNSIGGLNVNKKSYFFNITSYLPVNPKLWVGDILEWNYSGDFNESQEVAVNEINNILGEDCNCTDCSIVGTDCRIPFTFNTQNKGGFNITLKNFTYAYGIDNCTNSFSVPSNATTLNISFFDISSNLRNSIFEYIFDYGPNTTSYGYYITSSGYTTNTKVCKYPSWGSLYTDALINYNGTYTYNTNTVTLTNITQNINLIVQEGTSEVTFTVIDYDTQPVKDAYIQVQVYDITTNSYKTTEILKTDSDGEAVGNIILADKYYRFIIQYEGETKLVDPSSQGVKIFTTTRTFRISLGAVEWYDNYDEATGVSSTFAFNETGTNSFVFDWTNPTGTGIKGCLEVIQKNQTSSTNIFSSCEESAGTSIIATITPTDCNNYMAVAYFEIDGDIFNIPDSPLELDMSCDYTFKDLKGDSGNLELVFLSWMIIIGLAFIGIFIPEISLILAMVGLVGSVAVGLFDLAWQWVIGIIVIGVFLMMKYNRK